MNFILDFSKKTGDFQSLSGTDLRVLALAIKYVKRNGEMSRLRQEPPEIKEVVFKQPKEKIVKPKKPKKGNGMDWEEVEGETSSEDEDEQILEKHHEDAFIDG